MSEQEIIRQKVEEVLQVLKGLTVNQAETVCIAAQTKVLAIGGKTIV